jgi:hypothetical protein
MSTKSFFIGPISLIGPMKTLGEKNGASARVDRTGRTCAELCPPWPALGVKSTGDKSIEKAAFQKID